MIFKKTLAQVYFCKKTKYSVALCETFFLYIFFLWQVSGIREMMNFCMVFRLEGILDFFQRSLTLLETKIGWNGVKGKEVPTSGTCDRLNFLMACE
jgi:hypothetical protein